jgi:hypothetical protein
MEDLLFHRKSGTGPTSGATSKNLPIQTPQFATLEIENYLQPIPIRVGFSVFGLK